MKMTHLIQILIILALPIRLVTAQIEPSVQSSTPSTKPVTAHADPTGSTATLAKKNEIETWLITDAESLWSAEEVQILQRVLDDTFGALEANGIDGKALINGYRFRHDAHPYVGEVEGLMGKIDHNVEEITLSDKAFTVMHGFAIYHELGHAVDYRLNRQLSEGFHGSTGGSEISKDSKGWQTAENYWLRVQGRDDREEATADAFAVLVMVKYAGLKPPLFARQPVTTDYDGISEAMALSLQASESSYPVR